MFDVSFIYKIVDKFSGPAERIQRAAASTKGAVKGMGDAAGRVGGAFQRAGGRLREFGSLTNIAGSAAINFGLALPTKRAIGFEQAVTNLDKAFDFNSAASRAQFINDLRELGPSMGLTAAATANLAFEAGKLGIAQEDIREFVELSAKASVAFDGLAIEQAGQVIGDLKTKFALGVEGVENMLDAVNSLADGTSRNGGEILSVLGRLSGQFATLEFPTELSAGLATFARQVSTSDELAASGMKMFLRELDQAALAVAPIETITETLEHLASLDISTRVATIEDTFGKEASVFVQSLVQNLDTMGATLGIVADKSNFAASMGGEFERQMATTAQQIQVARAQFDNLLITIGENLLPVVNNAIAAFNPFIESVGRFVQENPNIVKAAAAFAAVSAAVLVLAGGAGIILSLVSPIGLVVAAVVGLGAAIAATWDKIKGFLQAVIPGFEGLADTVKGAFGAASDFFGFGDDSTIANPGGAALAIQNSGTSPPGLAVSSAQANRLDGNIGIKVEGPGTVTDSRLSSDAGGDLGFNIGAPR